MCKAKTTANPLTCLTLIFPLLCLLPLSIGAQCDITDDYEDAEAWTQVGSQVEVIAGSVSFLDGSADGEQRRVHRDLGITLEPNHTWTVHVDFNVLFIGTTPTGPAVGHNIVALTAGTQEPLNDCPDIACTGNPASTQDGIMVAYLTPDPPDGSLGFSLIATNGGEEDTSALIPANILDTDYYITMERLSTSEARLSIYTDAERTTQLDSSPVDLALDTDLGGFTHVQHSNHARGDELRQLTGTVDNLCIEHPLTSTLQVVEDKQMAYPNPVKTQLYFHNHLPGAVRLIRSDGIVAGVWHNTTVIDLRHLPAGTYMLVTGEKGTMRFQRIVKL